MTEPKRPTTRMNIDVGQKARARLEFLSEETEQSFSEVLRNALAVYDLLREQVKGGRKLILQGPDGDKELIIPEFRP